MNAKQLCSIFVILTLFTFILVGCSGRPQATGGQSGTGNVTATPVTAEDDSTLNQALGDVLDESDDVTVEESV